MVASPEARPARADSDFLLHACFRQQARQTPDAVALHFMGGTIRYSALDEASDRVAVALRSHGIGDGMTVGLHAERSIRYCIAALGILKAHAAVVPLPPSYPEERLREILAFSDLDAVIDDAPAPLVAESSRRVLPLRDLERHAAGKIEGACSHDQAAFVLCSSGSTGQPKMIVRSHRSFFHRLRWTWSEWPYAQDEACVQKSHMTTTHSIYELFEPLLQGVPVHVIPDETVRDLEQFWDTIRAHRISRLLIVPSVLQASLDMPGFEAPPVRVLVLMGEYLHPTLAGRAIAAFPSGTAIFSIYGSTEASSTLVCDVRRSWRGETELPLGKPIAPEVQPFVLGPALEPVAAGESGLLHIAGPALFTGYFRNPGLTAEVLVRSPRDAAPLFNTHDQVRLLADGSLEFVGRIDHTVKVRGFRVDLGEVERALQLAPGVRQAIVMLGGTAAENPPLIAFCTPASVDQAALFAALRERLPAYMVPSVLVGLDAFPLTASGKADRRKLLEHFAHRAKAAVPAESLSATEARVLEIWRGVLGHGEIRRESHFFEIGGTSLSVFTAVHRLRQAFDLDRAGLSEHSIYQYPTLRQLADHIDQLKSGATAAAPAQATVAVTLKTGDRSRPPLFVIASSGGTLGAYDRLAKVLKTDREIVGIRDPYVWGGREPTAGYQEWISIYVEAIRERQPAGPYFVCAFSSAGAIGYEIARHLIRAGEEVAQLILIDPIGIAGELRGDFGYRFFEAYFRGRRSKLLARAIGWWWRVSGAGHRQRKRPGDNDFAMTRAEFERRAAAARRDPKVMRDLSSLFELNTGLPYAMTEADFAGVEPERYLATFLARVKSVTPDVDPETIERILVQYYCLQLPMIHHYRLERYDGRVELFEPAGPQVGLHAAHFRPYVRSLGVHVLPVGAPSERMAFACQNLSRSLRTHYRSMRDDLFVAKLADALSPMLK